MGLPDGDGDARRKWWAARCLMVDRIVMCCGGFWTKTFGVEIGTMLDG